MKESSSRSSPKYFRSPAHVKPSSTVLVRTRLAKSYSRLLPADLLELQAPEDELLEQGLLNVEPVLGLIEHR